MLENSSLACKRSSESTTRNAHWTVARSRNMLFTGRDDTIRKLENGVRNAAGDHSRQDQYRIVISGMGGQGKSEICLQLAYRMRHL